MTATEFVPTAPTVDTITTIEIVRFFRRWFEMLAKTSSNPDVAMQATLLMSDGQFKKTAQQYADSPGEFYYAIRPWFVRHGMKFLGSVYWSKDSVVPRDAFRRLSMSMNGIQRNAVLDNHMVVSLLSRPL